MICRLRFLASRVPRIAWAAFSLGHVLLAPPVWAQSGEPAFQAFFLGVCSNATGALASRCAETPGGTGDLSGDSEESLNPSQLLAVNEAALAQARASVQATQELVERRRDREDAVSGGWGVFGHVVGEVFDRDGTSRERGFDGDSYSLQIGADRRLTESTIVGGLLSFERADSEFDEDNAGVNFIPPGDDGDSETDSWSLTVYTSTYLSEVVYLDASASYGFSDYERSRNAVFQESTRMVPQTNVSARSDTDGTQLALAATLGLDAEVFNWTLSPYVRMSYIHSEVDGYREQDASGLQMQLDDESQSSLTTVLGVRGSRGFSTSFGVVVPQFRIEYEHEFQRDAETIASRFLLDSRGTSFRLEGDDPDRDYVNAAVGVALVLPNGWIPFAEYEGLIGHNFRDRHRVLIGVRKEL